MDERPGSRMSSRRLPCGRQSGAELLDPAADLFLHAERGVTLQAVAEILHGPAPEAAASG